MLSCDGMGGLMTVIAVSGSVVVLLALGRQKLLENCLHSLQSPEDEDACRLQNDPAPVSRTRLPPFSVIIKQMKEEKGQNSTREESNWGRILVEKKVNTNFNSDVLQSTKSSKSSMVSAQETCSGGDVLVKKKVRFSEDVVEPGSNGKEYRKQQTLAMRERLTPQENCSRNNHYHYHQQQHQQQQQKQKHGINNHPSSQSCKSWISDDAEQQMSHRDQVKSSLPANRMVLYNAIIQSRSRRSLAQYD